jgi:hypothetical protein
MLCTSCLLLCCGIRICAWILCGALGGAILLSSVRNSVGKKWSRQVSTTLHVMLDLVPIVVCR